MKNNAVEFIDIAPMIINLGPHEWVHPYINDYFEPDKDGYDTQMFDIRLVNERGAELFVFFKSKALTQKVDNWLNDEEKNDLKKSDLFAEPYINLNRVVDMLTLTLLEDVWAPHHPRGGQPLRTSPEFKKWFKDPSYNQFCFSRFGRKVNSFFNYQWKPVHFTPDCGMTTDTKSWWCDS
jgi:hypothetical protein